MNKKPLLTAAFILTLLFLTVAGTKLVNLATAVTPLPTLPPPIIIRSDGGITPSPNAPLPIQRVGDTYIFTNNIANTIEVQRDNIIIDGNGFTLTKPSVNTENLMAPIGWLPGIYLLNRNNVTIRNIKFSRCYTGITLEGSSNITITQNTIKHSTDRGIFISHCVNSSIIENSITDNYVGMELDNSSYLNIESNTISRNSGSGLWSFDLRYSNIKRNTFALNRDLTGYSGCGLYFLGSFNYIIENDFESNARGILFQGSSGSSSNNKIYHNNFIDNTMGQFSAHESPNSLDDGKEGNYWSDYNGSDYNGDGIGDTPYVFDANNIDHYPLMAPYVPDIVPPTVYIVSPENRTHTVNNVSLTFTVAEPISWIGYSLNGQTNVTIAGNTTLTGLPNGSYTLTVYAKDTAGNIGASETVNFTVAVEAEPPPEPQPSELFPTTWIVVAIVIVAVVGAALLVYFVKIRKPTEVEKIHEEVK